MLSQTVEYALRAAVQLASIAPGASTTAELAVITRVPPAYLAKVLQALGRAGIVTSHRGAGGGVSLTGIPRDVTILDIVEATDPIQRITTCPLGLASHGKKLCPLHKRLDAALEAVEDAFRETTLAEVVGDPSRIKPLCELRQTIGSSRERSRR
ncbi:MAG: Rrf2 family transcriptional regulator [Pirellulales bacterium]